MLTREYMLFYIFHYTSIGKHHSATNKIYQMKFLFILSYYIHQHQLHSLQGLLNQVFTSQNNQYRNKGPSNIDLKSISYTSSAVSKHFQVFEQNPRNSIFLLECLTCNIFPCVFDVGGPFHDVTKPPKIIQFLMFYFRLNTKFFC